MTCPWKGHDSSRLRPPYPPLSLRQLEPWRRPQWLNQFAASFLGHQFQCGHYYTVYMDIKISVLNWGKQKLHCVSLLTTWRNMSLQISSHYSPYIPYHKASVVSQVHWATIGHVCPGDQPSLYTEAVRKESKWITLRVITHCGVRRSSQRWRGRPRSLIPWAQSSHCRLVGPRRRRRHLRRNGAHDDYWGQLGDDNITMTS